MLDVIDGVRAIIATHSLLAPDPATVFRYIDTGEPPYDGWVANTIYVFEAEDADEHALIGTGPADRENFELMVVICGTDLGESEANRPSRAMSELLDNAREAVLEVVRNSRSKYKAPWVPTGKTNGNPTPWSHLQGRADVRYARTIGPRVAACRLSGWRILPTS